MNPNTHTHTPYTTPTPPPTVDEDGLDVHGQVQQVAHRGAVLQAGEHRVPEDGPHPLLMHGGALELGHLEHHPEVDQHPAQVVVAGQEDRAQERLSPDWL